MYGRTGKQPPSDPLPPTRQPVLPSGPDPQPATHESSIVKRKREPTSPPDGKPEVKRRLKWTSLAAGTPESSEASSDDGQELPETQAKIKLEAKPETERTPPRKVPILTELYGLKWDPIGIVDRPFVLDVLNMKASAKDVLLQYDYRVAPLTRKEVNKSTMRCSDCGSTCEAELQPLQRYRLTTSTEKQVDQQPNADQTCIFRREEQNVSVCVRPPNIMYAVLRTLTFSA